MPRLVQFWNTLRRAQFGRFSWPTRSRRRGLSRRRTPGAKGPYLLDLHIDKTYPTPIAPGRDRRREWEDND